MQPIDPRITAAIEATHELLVLMNGCQWPGTLAIDASILRDKVNAARAAIRANEQINEPVAK